MQIWLAQGPQSARLLPQGPKIHSTISRSSAFSAVQSVLWVPPFMPFSGSTFLSAAFDDPSPSSSTCDTRIPNVFMIIYCGDEDTCVSTIYPKTPIRDNHMSSIDGCSNFLYFHRQNFKFVVFVMNKVQEINADQAMRRLADCKIARIGLPIIIVDNKTPELVCLIYSAHSDFRKDDYLIGIHIGELDARIYALQKRDAGFAIVETFEMLVDMDWPMMARVLHKFKSKYRPVEVVLNAERFVGNLELIKFTLDIPMTMVRQSENEADYRIHRWLLDINSYGKAENRLLVTLGNASYQWRYHGHIFASFSFSGEPLPLTYIVKFSKPHDGDLKLYCRMDGTTTWEEVHLERFPRIGRKFSTALTLNVDTNRIIHVKMNHMLKGKKNKPRRPTTESDPMLQSHSSRTTPRHYHRVNRISGAVIICVILITLGVLATIVGFIILYRNKSTS